MSGSSANAVSAPAHIFGNFPGVHSSFGKSQSRQAHGPVTLEDFLALKDKVLALRKDVIKAKLANQSIEVKFATLGFKHLHDSTAFDVANFAAAKYFGLSRGHVHGMCSRPKRDSRREPILQAVGAYQEDEIKHE